MGTIPRADELVLSLYALSNSLPSRLWRLGATMALVLALVLALGLALGLSIALVGLPGRRVLVLLAVLRCAVLRVVSVLPCWLVGRLRRVCRGGAHITCAVAVGRSARICSWSLLAGWRRVVLPLAVATLTVLLMVVSALRLLVLVLLMLAVASLSLLMLAIASWSLLMLAVAALSLMLSVAALLVLVVTAVLPWGRGAVVGLAVARSRAVLLAGGVRGRRGASVVGAAL